MKLEDKKEKTLWLNNPNILSSLILLVIFLIIVSNQGYIASGNTKEIMSNVVNNNTVFILVFIYFVCLKFKFGKKNFNLLNLILLFLYFIFALTTTLQLFKVFSIIALLYTLINILLFIQLFHTLLRDTRYWEDYGIEKSPFNELDEDFYFNGLLVLSLLYFVINLLALTEIRDLAVALFTTIYYIFFSRFIYLYDKHLDKKKAHVNNSGNFDELREKIDEVTDKIKENDIVKSIGEAADKLVDKVDDIVDKSEDKLNEASEKIKEDIKETKEPKKSTTKKTTKKKTKTTKKSTKKVGDK